MFASGKSIKSLRQLFFEFRTYLELQKQYTKLEITEKLTVLLSMLILMLLVAMLGMMALFYLSFALALILAPWTGGFIASFVLIGCIHIILIALLVTFRQRWIINPMVNFLARLFLDKNVNTHPS